MLYVKGDLKMNYNIEIKNLNQFYGKKQELRDVNLAISQGMFGLLGRNVPRYEQKTLPIT